MISEGFQITNGGKQCVSQQGKTSQIWSYFGMAIGSVLPMQKRIRDLPTLIVREEPPRAEGEFLDLAREGLCRKFS